MRTLLLASLLCLVSSGFSTTAQACKCAGKVPVDAALAAAAAVFEGRVTATELVTISEGGSERLKITFKLVRVWKGDQNIEELSVTTRPSSASCGVPMSEGQSYLVYAKGSEDTLAVNSCSRTTPMSAAAEDLAALGAGITPVKVTNGPQPETADKAKKSEKDDATGATSTPETEADVKADGDGDCNAGGPAGLWVPMLLALAGLRRRTRASA